MSSYKKRCDEVILKRGKSGGVYVPAVGKTTKEILDFLNKLPTS